MIFLKKFVALMLVTLSLDLYANPEKFSYSLKEVEDIIVENEDGLVSVESDPSSSAISVSATKYIFGQDHCEFRAEKQGKTLRLFGGKKKSAEKVSSCKVDIQLKVVPVTSLHFKDLGSSNLKFKGITQKPLLFRVGSGSVLLDGQLLELEGTVGSGDVQVTGLLGKALLKSGSGSVRIVFSDKSSEKSSAQVSTGSGSIFISASKSAHTMLETGSGSLNVQYVQVPESGELQMRTGSGNMKVLMPKDSKILSQFRSGAGKIYNELGDQKDAKFIIYSDSGAGNLDLVKTL
ncbi:MAG: DUF4097 family beta strand repeat protein [Oligoflexales bacterium]|nr:DUF4097 family beta strand repeat protein [Oligoflexales bacterium]